MRMPFSFALLATVLWAQAPAQAPKVKAPAGEAAPGFESIDPEDCRAWLTQLASDEFEGRETGTAGYQKAADMVAAHFREFGLKAVGHPDAEGNPTYFHNVPFVRAALDPAAAVFEITGAPKTITLRPGEGFGATGLGELDVKAPVAWVVVGPRRSAADLDVSGKVVIVLSYDKDASIAATQGAVSRELHAAGAAAVVRIDDVAAARELPATSAVRKDKFNPARRPIHLYISEATAGAIAAAGDETLAAMIAKAKSGPEAMLVPTPLEARVKMTTTVTDIAVPNVVGFIEGSDPVLKSEHVIIGSHLDHLGRDRSGEIFNGADDDASGSTGLLAVARAFTKNARAPKRSIMFLAFCGEEMGLLGSEWYAEHPIFPLDSVVAELQMDMIGRSEEAHPSENPGNETAEENANTLHLVGTRQISRALHDLVVAVNHEHIGFELEYDQEGVYRRSDHYNFARHGIPIAFVFTGFHRDYHQTGDDVAKIDFPKLARVAKLIYMTAWEIAERPERLPCERGPRAK